MKTLIKTLLILLSANAGAAEIYRYGNSYGSEPFYGEINKILIYSPMAQKQKDSVEYEKLKQDLKNSVENERMETVAWQQLELQRQVETAKRASYNAKLETDKKIANYDRAWTLMKFKHSREYEILKDVKDQDNEMLDDIAWQSIQMRDDITWHQSEIK